ncbi:uncharacterized protein KY384_005009 [Bacidia gigantensis]|uniref:uncharacterized protein n=1 Tax=Bacidia gigantensis TaxID=2732470 RepID=UPI001D05BA45|nr:uncharacterized protein KY384_005009 [Bacidia gigantensis]KAG8530506.1 hypothetical protein KY384_005009 [Bacidia gigantensis]
MSSCYTTNSPRTPETLGRSAPLTLLRDHQNNQVSRPRLSITTSCDPPKPPDSASPRWLTAIDQRTSAWDEHSYIVLIEKNRALPWAPGMAHDIQSGVDSRSQFAASHPAKDQAPSIYETNGYLTEAEQATTTEEIGPNLGRGLCRPVKKYSGADLHRLSQAMGGDYASTPPIDVPRPKDRDVGQRYDNSHLKSGTHDAEHGAMSLEDYMRNRRPSISFSPEVVLDSGHHRALEEPIRSSLSAAKPIDKLALKEQERYPTRPFSLYRTQSEADITDYDSETGEPLRRPSQFDIEAQESLSSPLKVNSNLTLPLPPTADFDQAASLTSDLTASPILEEAQTPPDNMEILQSPISIFPPFALPTSYEDSSAWPKPYRQISGSKARGIFLERTNSMRQARRQSTRRSTSSSMSPASTFLSRFAREEELPEPDSEGQEVRDYVLGKQIGFGGFSVVKEAFTIEGDEKIVRAAKIVRKQLPGKEEAENDRLQAEFDHEVQIWRCMGHRNILPLLEVTDTDFATFCFTKLNTGGSLYDKIRVNRQGLDRDLARRYAFQLASAVRYLHEDVRIVHRDIKLENCLIDISDPDAARDGGNLLLCDFGLAEFVANDMRSNSPDPFNRRQSTHALPSQPSSPSDAAVSVAGSLQYASPELIMSPAGLLSPCVDIWAFGVAVFAMLVGDLPFQHTFQPRVQMMILAGEWDCEALAKAQGVAGYEEETVEFVQCCLDMSSDNRWTIGEVLSSRWMRGMQELLEEKEGFFKL